MEQQQEHRSDGIILPDDIVMLILSWLPLKSLWGCRQVCKRWKSLVSTYYLRELHRQRYSSSSPVILTFHGSNYGEEDDENGIEEYYLTAFDLHGEVIEQQTLPIASENLLVLPIPFQSKLVCLLDLSGQRLFAYNPSTRQLLSLPAPPRSSWSDFRDYTPILGYIPSRDEYMLVHISKKRELESFVREVLTFTISERDFLLNVEEWSSIKVPSELNDSNLFLTSNGVFARGVFYWKAGNKDGNIILSFDVETGVFSTLRWPRASCCSLLELKDELYVMNLSNISLVLNLFKLVKDGNGNNSWNRYKKINLGKLGFDVDSANDSGQFLWKIFVYRIEYLQWYNEPIDSLVGLGMLKLPTDVVDYEEGDYHMPDYEEGDYYMPDYEEGDYYMPEWKQISTHTNFFTI